MERAPPEGNRTPADGRRTLLLVTPGFPPGGGGLELYALNLARCLIRQGGWRVVVATAAEVRGSGRGGRPLPEDPEAHLTVYRLPYQLKLSNTRLGMTWRRDLKRILAVERPDVINAHAPVPGLADLVAGLGGSTPFVVTYHLGSMRKGRMPVDAGIAAYERYLLPRMFDRAHWLIASSDPVRDSILRGHREKSSTVTPAVDSSLFCPAQDETRPRDRVLFVADLHRGDTRKGLALLLAAITTLRAARPDISLSVVGSGNDVARYQALCRSLGIEDNVRFLGRLGRPEVVAAYQQSSVMALPSTNDSFPLVLLEAMACALPVVSTTVGGIPTLVDDGEQGFLVPPGDLAALTERLARVLDDPALAERLGRAGRAKVEASFTWEGQAARTAALFDTLLSTASGA